MASHSELESTSPGFPRDASSTNTPELVIQPPPTYRDTFYRDNSGDSRLLRNVNRVIAAAKNTSPQSNRTAVCRQRL
jgi:hypothetical protein